VVVEPTGPAWLPIAVFFGAGGHTVYRVSSAKAADLRRFLSRHAKSNGIDADTLARLPLVDPAGLHALELPDAPRAALDRRVRATDRLTQAGAAHKRRIKDLVRQLLPMSPLAGDLGQADLAVLERYADPRVLLAAGPARLQQLIAKASTGHQGATRAQQWRAAAHAALELYGDHPAVAFADLAAEVATEVRLLRATQAELARHAPERESCYRWVDPGALARSLPGLAEVGGPALVATMGPASRFPTAAKFRSFTGLAPKASETGQVDRKPQPISKAGNRLLRTTLVRAADTARRQDPPAGPPLLDPDGPTRQRPPRCPVCSRRPSGRAGLGSHGPRHALCHLRHRRHPGHSGAGQGDHRPALDRARTGPPAAARQEGEGPSASPHRTWHERSRPNEATLPGVQSWTTGAPRQASPGTHLTANPP
jgi:transposase